MPFGSAKKYRRTKSPLDRSETNRDIATRHEKASAKQFGGRVKPGSGSTAFSKGDVDVRSVMVLLDGKGTKHASITVKAEDLVKITHQAAGEGRDPGLDLEIRGISDPMTEKRWIAIPASVFQRLIQNQREGS